MEKQKITSYEALVYVAYGYFILLGVIDLVLSLLWGGFFNFYAFFAVAVFGVQAWYKHRVTNLILGVLTLAGSIFVTLEFLAKGHKMGFGFFINVMAGISLLGIIMSGILIFSYTKLSFQDN